jgi:antitoxin (DNA-binding transcriptional repressor) of toxin-antitoxin stability system
MITINIHEAKTHLSHYISLVEAGETVVLAKRNVPIAEIRPIVKKQKRPLGLAKGQVEIPKSFYEPLPPELLKFFSGED